VSLWRFNTGQIFFYDFGHYARIIWLISRSLPPVIVHKVLGEIHFFGDHLAPSFFLLAPLFLITNKLQILLIEQALMTVTAGLLIFTIAKRETLRFFPSLACSVIFLLFAGVESPLVSDWHSESTAIVLLLLFLYSLIYRKNIFIAFLSAIIFMGFKDSNPLSLFFILIPYFYTQKKDRRIIAFYMGFALLWFITAGYILTPLIAKQAYLYAPVLPVKPTEYITNFVNLPIKRKLWFDSLSSFGFLPLFSGVFFIPILAELSIRLLPTYVHSQSFTLGMHYNVFLGAFLAIASIKSLRIINSLILPKKVLISNGTVCIALIIALFTAKTSTHPPLLLAINPVFWKEWNKKSELFKQIQYIETTGSVMSQNNILPHLISRKDKVFLLSLSYKKYDPQHIAFDLSTGQNINNYYSGEIKDIEQVIKLKEFLLEDPHYKRVSTPYRDFYVFKKQ